MYVFRAGTITPARVGVCNPYGYGFQCIRRMALGCEIGGNVIAHDAEDSNKEEPVVLFYKSRLQDVSHSRGGQRRCPTTVQAARPFLICGARQCTDGCGTPVPISEGSPMKPAPIPGPQTFSTDSVLDCAARSRLLRISVEVTRECNLSCRYCYVPVTPSLGAPLTLAEILQIAHEARSCGAKTFVIIGGEPLLYDDLCQLVVALSVMGYSISLFSNLCYLTKSLAEFLHKHGVFVTGKLHSLDASVSDFLCGQPGAHNLMLKGISLLECEGFAEGEPPTMALHSVIAKENVSEIPTLFRWMRKRRIVPHLQLLTRVAGAGSHMSPLNPKEAESLFKTLLAIDETEFGYTWTPVPPLVGWSCQQYYCGLYVTNDASVKICSSSRTVLASLREHPMEEILQFPIMKQLRSPRQHIHGPCHDCPAHPTCYGCRADAEGICGSLFSQDQYCWRPYNARCE